MGPHCLLTKERGNDRIHVDLQHQLNRYFRVIGEWRREKLMYGTLRSACLLGQQAGNDDLLRQRLPRVTDIQATRPNYAKKSVWYTDL